ncbi:MAG: DUF2837 family protein [bacterium]
MIADILSDKRFIVVFIITFFIYFSGSAAASIRFAGIKTKLLNTSYSLANVIFLIVRLSNLLQTPFLGSMVDIAYKENSLDLLRIKIHLIILASTLGSIIGIFFFSTSEIIFRKWVELFDRKKSVLSTIAYALSFKTIIFIIKSLTIPKFYLKKEYLRRVPRVVFFSCVIIGAFWTTGVLSAIYASVIVPEYARTATILSGIVNGVATILFTIFLDPIVANITDKVYNNQENIEYLYNVMWVNLVGTVLGTILAQIVFLPGAIVIAYITTLFSKI